MDASSPQVAWNGGKPGSGDRHVEVIDANVCTTVLSTGDSEGADSPPPPLQPSALLPVLQLEESHKDDEQDTSDSASSSGSERMVLLEKLKSSSATKLRQLQQSASSLQPWDEQSLSVGAAGSSGDCVDSTNGMLQPEDELERLRKEVSSLTEQNQQLLALRGQMDNEIENLTSSLFEEAYKMVNEAKAARNVAEKNLAAANGKIDALEAEIIALRVLLEHNGTAQKGSLPPSVAVGGRKKALSKKMSDLKHQRSQSVGAVMHQQNGMNSSTASTPSNSNENLSQSCELLHSVEVDESDFAQFTKWREAVSLDLSDLFIGRIVATDIAPCISFFNKQLSEELQAAVLQNSLQMELLTVPSTQACALTGCKEKPCPYKMRLKDTGTWHYISLGARNKIATVCNFIMFLRYIQQGLVKSSNETTYVELCKHRASMHLRRLGLEFQPPKP